MQQFVVPQFIDVEDKVIGPITVRQFIILLVGSGLIFAAYKLSDFSLFVFLSIVIAVLTFSIAFIKINGKPVHYLILNLIETFRKPRIRAWGHDISSSDIKIVKNGTEEKVIVTPVKNHVRASRLAELSLVVDTGGVYQGEAATLPKEDLV